MAPGFAVYFSLLCFLFLTDALTALTLRPNCGFPGKPYNARILPQEKLVYSEGDSVTIECTSFKGAPQTRQCLNGAWSGPAPRCGSTFPSNLLVTTIRTVDLTTSQQLWNYSNIKLPRRPWTYPNAFSSSVFKGGPLRLSDDHAYQWNFTFTKPMGKLFVKISFTFPNFTLLPEEIKSSRQLDISVEVSPYRRCTLQFQDPTGWEPFINTGNRVDTFFVCDFHNYEAHRAEMNNLPNYLSMRTKLSHSLIHQLRSVSFGRSYGTLREPLCGEPETDYGQSFRANQKNRNYVLDCANTEDWIKVRETGWEQGGSENQEPIYSVTCSGGMLWKGTYPNCIPKKVCPLNLGNFPETKLSNSDVTLAGSLDRDLNTGTGPNLVIESISKYYHYTVNDTIYPTTGTELTFSCLDAEFYILVGKNIRKCQVDGFWSGRTPTCRFIGPSTDTLESSTSLLFTIVLIAATLIGIILILLNVISCCFCFFYRKHKKEKRKMSKAQKQKAVEAGLSNSSERKPFLK